MRQNHQKKKRTESKRPHHWNGKALAKRKEETEWKEGSDKDFWNPGNMLYPLPAVMVSCQVPGEKPNIITVAWTATICSNPAMVSISVRPERHSYDILRKTKEFVINLTTKELANATDSCGVSSGRDTDKFEKNHLTPGACRNIKAPLIKESPVNIECIVKKMIPLGSHVMFLAEVVGVHVSKKYLNSQGKLELHKAGLMAYSHGEYYELGKKIGGFGFSVRKKRKK